MPGTKSTYLPLQVMNLGSRSNHYETSENVPGINVSAEGKLLSSALIVGAKRILEITPGVKLQRITISPAPLPENVSRHPEPDPHHAEAPQF